ncbi:glycosyltransferase family 4 protein [Aquimarina pacifica]|uniref:glycosyltransferase family 4 protein n=1 Tax=Aquimarina pacifica TaxID=1296415 RepID=UPI00046F1D3E|nr:glycosyltransferase family 4 protein [Aquimarina pacifica]
MKVLFVSSGNTINGISPLVLNQGNSLKSIGHNVSFFTIKEKGIRGYVKHIFLLKKFLKEQTHDVVHAHYSLSAIVAGLAGAKPLVVSLMGSDVKASPLLKFLIKFCNLLFWEKIIVKSKDMKKSCGIANVAIIPNGVDFTKFRQLSKTTALDVTKWSQDKKHILFAANPKRKEKNYQLAQKAVSLLDTADTELHVLVDIPNELMPYYFNASDVILLTSLWEGSPNVIKEAMACNCKIVAVDVGDIKNTIGKTSGCFITDFDAHEIANSLQHALHDDPKYTSGRNQIAHLDANIIAKKLTNLYTEAL